MNGSFVVRAMGAALAGTVLALGGCGGGDSDDDIIQPNPPPGAPALSVTRVFANLATFNQPVALLQAPSDNTRWFVVEKSGRVLAFENNSTVTTSSVFIDITDRVSAADNEMGLLSMAFHPAFPSDPRVFLYYTHGTSNADRVSRLAVFTTPNLGIDLNKNTEQILLTVNQPENNHKGGTLAFDSNSGLLYLGLGDGGGSNDQHGTIGNAQLMTTLLGKMLRIDINGSTQGFPYGIPADNPFGAGNTPCGTNGSGTQACPEIYALGFRNPWRWSFDKNTGQMWVADVGQGAMEEVDRVTSGGNYGWRCFEGTNNTGFGCGSPSNPISPIAQYGHSLGFSITGGYVYRGTANSSLVGRYVFGDYGSGRIWSIANDTQPTVTMTGGFESGLKISSFGQANDGEIYVLDYDTGRIFRLGTT